VTIEVRTPVVNELASVVTALASFQCEGPVQLHPGDVGWNQMAGPEATAAALRVWERDGVPVVIGFLDEPTVIRLGVSPEVAADDEVARVVAEDLTGTGVLTEGRASVEARYGDAVQHALRARGWVTGDPWACFRGDLSVPVPDCGLRVEVVDGARVADRVAVQRAAFERSRFTEEKWRTMVEGPAYEHARCLVGYDGERAVAMITVWSAGRGRPGLIEPMGVHRDHRGRGHGRAITLAGAAALRGMGASSVLVATPASNTSAVATYSAVLDRLPDVADLTRP
jgi:hypothetical protein